MAVCILESQIPSNCSIQEARSLRTQVTSDAAPVNVESLEAPQRAAGVFVERLKELECEIPG
jgi:hypothetical protein